MPVLIMMNKPYDDDDALETVVQYVLRPGYGYCGAYGVDLNDAVFQMQRAKIMAVESVILSCLSNGLSRWGMSKPWDLGLRSASIMLTTNRSTAFIMIQSIRIYTLRLILFLIAMGRCMRKELRIGTG